MLIRKTIRSIILLLCMFSASLALAALPTWEYLAKTFPIMGNDQALTQVLNELGKDHWELVNCTEGDAELICIFKRPVEQD